MWTVVWTRAVDRGEGMSLRFTDHFERFEEKVDVQKLLRILEEDGGVGPDDVLVFPPNSEMPLREVWT